MLEGGGRAGTEIREERRKRGGHRLERIGTVLRQYCGARQQPASDVEQDERRAGRGGAPPAAARVLVQRHVGREGEIAGAHEKAAQDQADHAQKHAGGQKIGGETERSPTGAARAEGKKALHRVHRVDQEVKEKAVEDERMQERDERPLLEYRLLRGDDPEGAADALGQTVEAVFRLAAPDRLEYLIKAGAREIKCAQGERDKKDFFYRREHRVRLRLRIISIPGAL